MRNLSKKGIQELILNALSRKKISHKQNITLILEELLNTEKTRKVKPRYLINRTIKKMINDNIIEKHETEQSSFLSLTPSGKQKLQNIRLSSKKHLISTTWDGYWRVIIIDIPENRKKDQDAIRYILKKAQFVQLKSSVWISPYPLEHMMINMKRDMSLEKEIIVFVTNKLDIMTEQMLINTFANKKEN